MYTIELSEKELNIILGSLSQAPYHAVAGVISTIQSQANKQFEHQAKAEE